MTATATPTARRGSRNLQQEEFRAHLERLFRLENLAVLVGAGPSIPLGGEALSSVWPSFVEQHADLADWLAKERFVTKGAGTTDVEQLLDTLAIAEREWVRQEHVDRAQLGHSLAALRREVLKAGVLQASWWESGVELEDSDKLNHHRRLLLRLLASRQPGQAAPWIFTLNYDLAFEWAAETAGVQLVNGFSGLHRRVFSPHHFDLGFRSVVARGEAQFGAYYACLAKLHGSLSWLAQPGRDVEEAPAGVIWPRLSRFLQGAGADDWPGLLVLPSVLKYEQTVGFVVGELMRRFSEFLARAQTALIVVGYSFGDAHVNRLLLSGLQNPTLQLVVYRPELTWSTEGLTLGDTAGNPFIGRLLDLEAPQVTFKGEGKAAHFDALVADLPEPAMMDAEPRLLRDLRSLVRTQPPNEAVPIPKAGSAPK